MKMEPIVSSETSAIRNSDAGELPKKEQITNFLPSLSPISFAVRTPFICVNDGAPSDTFIEIIHICHALGHLEVSLRPRTEGRCASCSPCCPPIHLIILPKTTSCPFHPILHLHSSFYNGRALTFSSRLRQSSNTVLSTITPPPPQKKSNGVGMLYFTLLTVRMVGDQSAIYIFVAFHSQQTADIVSPPIRHVPVGTRRG